MMIKMMMAVVVEIPLAMADIIWLGILLFFFFFFGAYIFFCATAPWFPNQSPWPQTMS